MDTTKMDTTLRTLQKKRTANFREDETKLLIQLWGSPSIQNKLFLTHRKAPVMRLLAANMQQRGFYRTPDEIKTRIRNLKCLYHRIKRTMACGTGIGTVDPDWAHFKAMDEILTKEYPRKLTDRINDERNGSLKFDDAGAHHHHVDVKQEMDDIDIDDDSWATNESLNSEYDEESQTSSPAPPPPPPPPQQQQAAAAKKAAANNPQVGSIKVKQASSLLQQPLNAGNAGGQIKMPANLAKHLLPTIQLPTGQMAANANGQKGTIPFPLLILNSMNHAADKNAAARAQSMIANTTVTSDGAVSVLLKELIEVQKESLALTKEKLDVEKQRLEFDRLIGSHLVELVPMLGGLVQRLAGGELPPLPLPQPQHNDPKFGVHKLLKRKRSASEADDFAKSNKMLRTMLEEGIRKYMFFDEEADKEARRRAPYAVGDGAEKDEDVDDADEYDVKIVDEDAHIPTEPMTIINEDVEFDVEHAPDHDSAEDDEEDDEEEEEEDEEVEEVEGGGEGEGEMTVQEQEDEEEVVVEEAAAPPPQKQPAVVEPEAPLVITRRNSRENVRISQ